MLQLLWSSTLLYVLPSMQEPQSVSLAREQESMEPSPTPHVEHAYMCKDVTVQLLTTPCPVFIDVHDLHVDWSSTLLYVLPSEHDVHDVSLAKSQVVLDPYPIPHTLHVLHELASSTSLYEDPVMHSAQTVSIVTVHVDTKP